MTEKVTQINKEALEPVITTRAKALDLAQAAEQAMKDARLAELEFKVQIQQLYLEKQLDQNCRVDITTGIVTWPDEAVDAPAAEDKSKRKRTVKKKAETTEATEVEAE